MLSVLFFQLRQRVLSIFPFYSLFTQINQASRASSELDEAYSSVSSWIDEVRALKGKTNEGRIDPN